MGDPSGPPPDPLSMIITTGFTLLLLLVLLLLCARVWLCSGPRGSCRGSDPPLALGVAWTACERFPVGAHAVEDDPTRSPKVEVPAIPLSPTAGTASGSDAVEVDVQDLREGLAMEGAVGVAEEGVEERPSLVVR